MAGFSELQLIAEPIKNEIRDSITSGIKQVLLDMSEDLAEAKREVQEQLAQLIENEVLLEQVSGAVLKATERAIPKAQIRPFLAEAIRLAWPKLHEAQEVFNEIMFNATKQAILEAMQAATPDDSS